MTDDEVSPKSPSGWSYAEAFSRQMGLFSAGEQTRLRRTRVAIPGMGGVGGIHLVTLARLGVGAFHIADPDRFDLANFNRQHGATTRSLGRLKAEVMAEEARAINPEIQLRVFTEALTERNVAAFLEEVDVVVDGLDFFALEVRRLLFREARRRGIWALTAGPLGFSVAWLAFAPDGLSFDEYFDLHDGLDPAEGLVSFFMGLAPRATQRAYMDLSAVDPGSGRGPSSGLACQLCAGVIAAELVKIILGRGPVRAVPWSFQFDAYQQRLEATRLRKGNATPIRRWLRRRLRTHFSPLVLPAPSPNQLGGTLPGEFLAAAVLAPSGDNTQPWRFVVSPDEGTITLKVDASRDTSPMNAGGRMSRIAAGAAIENMIQAAQGMGWNAALETVTHPAAPVIRFGRGPSPVGGILREIRERVTNRRTYDGRPVPADLLACLRRETPGLAGIRTHWIVDRERLPALASLIGRADALMFGEPSMRRAFLAKVRFDAPRHALVEEGLPLASLELSFTERSALHITCHLPDLLLKLCGATRAFAARATKLVESASGLCLVVAPDGEEATDLFVGRAAERAWLALTRHGFAAQPMMSLLVLDNLLKHGGQKRLEPLWREKVEAALEEFRRLAPETGDGRPAFLMRLGFAPAPSGRSGRLPPQAVSTQTALTGQGTGEAP